MRVGYGCLILKFFVRSGHAIIMIGKMNPAEELAELLADETVDAGHPAVERHMQALEISGYECEVTLSVAEFPAHYPPLQLEQAVHCLRVSSNMNRAGRQAGEVHRYFFPAQVPGLKTPHVFLGGMEAQLDVTGRAAFGHQVAYRGLKSFEALGYKYLSIKAGMTDGRSQWARAGFDFATTTTHTKVREFFTKNLPKIGVDPAVVSAMEHPLDYWRLGEPLAGDTDDHATVGVCVIAPERDLFEIAEDIDVDPNVDLPKLRDHREERSNMMHVGKALMLLGPEWHGAMEIASLNARRWERWGAENMARAAGTRPSAVP